MPAIAAMHVDHRFTADHRCQIARMRADQLAQRRRDLQICAPAACAERAVECLLEPVPVRAAFAALAARHMDARYAELWVEFGVGGSGVGQYLRAVFCTKRTKLRIPFDPSLARQHLPERFFACCADLHRALAAAAVAAAGRIGLQTGADLRALQGLAGLNLQLYAFIDKIHDGHALCHL